MRLFFRICGILILLLLIPGTGISSAKTKKVRVDRVSFQGINAFREQRLSKAMVTRSSRFFNPNYYNEDIFREDIKSLERFYHNNGYLEAAVADYHVAVDSTRHKVSIMISVQEGEATHIEGVNIFGNTVFADSLLFSNVKISAGERFQRKKIDDGTIELLTLYANNGYLDADVKTDIRINTETHRALIDYNITENSKFSIGEISFQGLDKTRNNVVIRELLFKSGEVINYSRLLETQHNIYMTGLFQSVFIRPQVSVSDDSLRHEAQGRATQRKDILVDVKENMAGEFNVALGYGSVDKARTRVEVLNNNVKGSSLKLGMAGKVSMVQYGVETSLTNPWTFGIPLRSDVNFFIERKDEPGYDLARIGGRIVLGRQINNKNVTLTYRHERVRLSNIEIDTIPDDLISNTRSLKLMYIHDTRNNMFNASKGMYIEASSEFGAFFTDVTSTFYRFIGQIKYFRELNNKSVIGTSLELGLLDSEDGYDAIPLHERFYTGGPMSLRGFKYERVGPLDSKNLPVGGRFKIVWNICELRHTLYKMIGGVLFVDTGNVWSQPENISFHDIRISPGIGLRVTTPIGLARLDYGFNIDRQNNESAGHIYFNMGQAF